MEFHLKLSSANFLLPMISLKLTLNNYQLYGFTCIFSIAIASIGKIADLEPCQCYNL